MYIKCSLLLSITLVISSCYSRTAEEIHIITDFGDYSSINQAYNCEEVVDWYDGNTLDDSRCTRAFAAQELRDHIVKITSNSQQVKVLKPGNSLSFVDSIIIADIQHLNGYEAYGISDYIQKDSMQSQGYLIRTIQQNGRKHVLIVGADRAGALYGVYELLQSMGVRWYGPGSLNEVIPVTNKFSLPVINVQESPAFITRGFWAKDDRGDVDFFNWMARNRINLWSYAQPERNALRKRAIGFLTGGHQIQKRFLNPELEYPYKHNLFNQNDNYLPDPYPVSPLYAGDVNNSGNLSYSEAHPEWFGLINGKRNFDNRIKYGTNFCTSNKHAVNEISKNFINDLIDGEWSEADMINFWPIDVGKWCECELCRDIGSETDRMLMLVHQVRNSIDEAISSGLLQRKVVLTIPAYLETRKAPTRELPEGFDYYNNVVTFFPIERCYSHAMNDANCTEINHHHNSDMKSWLRKDDNYYKGTMFLGEYYNVSFLASLPVMYTNIMSEDLPYYYKSGIRHMHYMHVEVDKWGTMLPNNYQFARMLWNPLLDADVLNSELYKNFYGSEASRLMKKFYHHLELAMSSMKIIRWAGRSLDDSYSLDQRLNADEPLLFTSPHLQLKETSGKYNDGRDIEQMLEDIDLARIYINQALEIQKEKIFNSRISEVEQRFSYGEAMIYFYKNIIDTHIAHHNGNSAEAMNAFIETSKYVNKLKKVKDIIGVVGGTLKAGDGFTATFNVDTYNRYKRIYGNNNVD